MVTFNVGYNPTDNVFSINNGVDPIALPLSGGGSLTIDVDAFVRNSSPNLGSFAAKLETGAWTVTVNGLLEQTGSADGFALVLNDIGSALKSAVTIGESGVVRAATQGIVSSHTTTISLTHATSYLEASGQAVLLLGASNTITNKGYITSTTGPTVVQLLGSGNHTVTNSGVIYAQASDGAAIEALSAAKTTITNQASGGISGQIVLGAGNDVITNSGFIGALQLGNGNNTVTNLGASSRIDFNSTGLAISGGSGNDVIANGGDIAGCLNLGDGDNRITGAGRFFSSVPLPVITMGGGNDTISVTGLIDGDIVLGEGRNMASVAQSGAISGGSGNDTVVVSKSVSGTVDLGEGNNSISGAGSVIGITLGSGNDTVSLTGNVLGPMELGDGRNIASVGQSGAITGGSGNDTVSASKNVGAINLGEGINSFTAAANVLGSITFGNLADTLNVKGTIFGIVNLGAGNNTATVSEVQGSIIGGSGNDVIVISKLMMTGDIDLGEGKNSIKGAGAISASKVFFGSDDDVLALTGTVTGAVILGSSTIRNTANITELQGNLTGGNGNDVVTVSKLINGSVDLLGASNSLTGAGAVTGDILFGKGDDVLALTGKITGNVLLGGAATKNTATISELQGSLTGGGGNDVVTVSKLINGAVDLLGSNNSLTGAGAITGNILFGAGDDVLSLAGTITGFVDLGGAVVKNTATITTLNGNLFGGAQNDVVTVSKLINGSINLMDGTNSLTGAGGVNGSINLGVGDDVLSLAGPITGNVGLFDAITKNVATVGDVGGMIIGGDQIDIVTINGFVNGTITGVIELKGGADKITLGAKGEINPLTGFYDYLGAGNDTFIGNGLSNTIGDGDGLDSYQLLGGDDWFYAVGATSDLADTIDGGLGNDFYDAHGGVASVTINLGALLTDGLVGTVQGTKATGTPVGTDTVTGFEHALGGDGDDVIVGTSGFNMLFGNGGADKLLGLAGNDVIEGGMGTDHIVGGAGADFLSGFVGDVSDGLTDIFYYRSISESTVSPAGRDLIRDFEVDSDQLDFTTIDAVTVGNTTNDDFRWRGENGEFVLAGDMRYVHTKGYIAFPTGFFPYSGDITILSADVNGDRKADFAVAFVGHVDLQTAYNESDLLGVI